MASQSKSERALENLKKDLKIGVNSNKSVGNLYVAKDGSSLDAMSCISSGDATNSIRGSEVDQETLVAEHTMYYPVNGVYGYYYPGFDGSMRDWEDSGYYFGTDGLEIQHPVTQPENESLVYYFPSFQAGYSYNNLVSPGAVVGVDGQYFAQHFYQPGPVFHQSLASPDFVPQPFAFGPEVVPVYVWDSSPIWDSGLYGNGYATFAKQGAASALNASHNTAIQNQAHKSMCKVNNELSKSFVQTNKCNSYPNTGKNALLIPSIADNAKTTGKTWFGAEKQKAANQPLGSGGLDMLNVQNRDPRTIVNQDAWVSDYDSTTCLGADNNNDALVASIKKEYSKLPDFSTKYDYAFFFIIKSYSEDDVHKSIKYNVWASTPNGNKRLDNAYQVAQEKVAEKGSVCPVFLFFSVNASGQFCGVAEMIDRVDFNKNMDFWQQDKWNGYFPVKWHIIKDIPNPQFRHIILENNENKPVTNSRDTQEVKFSQGIEMLNIFKNYSAKTSILDDFGFYESRQKAMQDKRIKPPITKFEHLTLKTEVTAKVAKSSDLLEAGSKASEELQAESGASMKK